MRPQPLLQPLPYAFRSRDGRLLVVGEADLWTEEAILLAEWYGIDWHGETLPELHEQGPRAGSPALRATA